MSARRGTGVVLAAAVFLAFAVISCRTVNRSGGDAAECAAARNTSARRNANSATRKSTRTFTTADHARLIAEGPNALEAGCESCHGPASLHSDSGGEVKPPYSFTAGRPAANNLRRAAHDACHARATETVCFHCHAEVRGQFSLPSHHPVPEGKMTCTDCHSPHKGFAIYERQHGAPGAGRKLSAVSSRATRTVCV